jgi:HAE1 family hydrophobic/amphiphilic exporter-1
MPMGGKNYSMRIWLDPNKLAAYGLNPTDVTAAINEQSRERQQVLSDKTVEVLLNISSNMLKYNSKEQYDNIIIKSLETDKT